MKILKSVKAPHWYKLIVQVCPVCGNDRSYKIRMYGTKPKDARKLTEVLPDASGYDYCLEDTMPNS